MWPFRYKKHIERSVELGKKLPMPYYTKNVKYIEQRKGLGRCKREGLSHM